MTRSSRDATKRPHDKTSAHSANYEQEIAVRTCAKIVRSLNYYMMHSAHKLLDLCQESSHQANLERSPNELATDFPLLASGCGRIESLTDRLRTIGTDAEIQTHPFSTITYKFINYCRSTFKEVRIYAECESPQVFVEGAQSVDLCIKKINLFLDFLRDLINGQPLLPEHVATILQELIPQNGQTQDKHHAVVANLEAEGWYPTIDGVALLLGITKKRAREFFGRKEDRIVRHKKLLYRGAAIFSIEDIRQSMDSLWSSGCKCRLAPYVDRSILKDEKFFRKISHFGMPK
jgi:hypothetical protein